MGHQWCCSGLRDRTATDPLDNATLVRLFYALQFQFVKWDSKLFLLCLFEWKCNVITCVQFAVCVICLIISNLVFNTCCVQTRGHFIQICIYEEWQNHCWCFCDSVRNVNNQQNTAASDWISISSNMEKCMETHIDLIYITIYCKSTKRQLINGWHCS